MTQPPQKLKLGALIAIVIGSMIGSGIFNLPMNAAKSAGAGATLVAWIIAGIGTMALAFVFQSLANRKPDLDSGIYAYAKAGFGDYLGFNSAWGYWIAAFIGNVSFYVILFATLKIIFPPFGDGNTLPAIIGSSITLWIIHWLILRGIKEAAFINQLTTIAKVVPIVLFIIIALFAFKFDIFTKDFWAVGSDLGSVLTQIKGMMAVAVWVFVGIEGASVFSSYAEKRSDVGRATVIGFLITLALLVLVNMLSFGIMSQPELAKLSDPSMAGVLEHVVGPWGKWLVSIGVVVSVAGALIAWTLLTGEILYVAAKDGTMPAFLARQNSNGVPANSMWLSNGVIQIFLIITLFNSSTYLNLVYLASSTILLPYLFSGGYALLLAMRGETYEQDPKARSKDMISAIIAVAYAIWLVYAAGPKYLLLSALLYLPGSILYFMGRKEKNLPIFKPYEWAIFAAIAVAALVAGLGLMKGTLTL